MTGEIFTILAAAFVAIFIGIVDALMVSIGVKNVEPRPSASDAWYD